MLGAGDSRGVGIHIPGCGKSFVSEGVRMEYVLSILVAAVIIYVLRRMGAKSGHSNDLDD